MKEANKQTNKVIMSKYSMETIRKFTLSFPVNNYYMFLKHIQSAKEKRMKISIVSLFVRTRIVREYKQRRQHIFIVYP